MRYGRGRKWLVKVVSLKWAAAVGMTVCSLSGPWAQALRAEENQRTGSAVREKYISPAEAELTRQIAYRDRRIEDLQKLLAESNAEARAAAEELDRLKERDAALGIAALTGDEKSLQNKLLQALRGAAVSEKKRDELASWVARLVSAVEMLLHKCGADAPETAPYADLVAGAKQAVAQVESGADEPADWLNCRVVESKPESGILILGVGWRHGIKIGMVFEIYRGDQKVAEARAVDVREKHSGAFVSGHEVGQPVAAGDRAKVKTVMPGPGTGE